MNIGQENDKRQTTLSSLGTFACEATAVNSNQLGTLGSTSQYFSPVTASAADVPFTFCEKHVAAPSTQRSTCTGDAAPLSGITPRSAKVPRHTARHRASLQAPPVFRRYRPLAALPPRVRTPRCTSTSTSTCTLARNPQSQAAPPSAILFHHRATEIESSKKKRSLGHGLRCATRPGPQNLTPTRSCFVASGIFVRCFTFAGKQETRLCIPDLLHGVVRASKGALPAGSRCL